MNHFIHADNIDSTLTLEQCEELIYNGVMMLGAGLAEIFKGHLWKGKGYRSWRDYVERRWHRSRQWAYELIKAAEFSQALKESHGLILESTSHAKALKAIPEQDRGKVIDILKELAPGKLTEGLIGDAYETVKEQHITGHVEVEEGIQQAVTGSVDLTLKPREGLSPGAASTALKAQERWLRHLEHKDSGKQPPLLELLGLSVEDAVNWLTIAGALDLDPATPAKLTLRKFEGRRGKGFTLRVDLIEEDQNVTQSA